MNDYYELLGVSRDAPKDEIKKAFRRLAHKHHPDKGGDEKKFKEINEAYQVLSDDKKKAQYDQFGSTFDSAGQGGFDFSNFAQGFSGFQGGDGGANFEDIGIGDIFSQFFGGRGGGHTGPTYVTGEDMEIRIDIDLGEVLHGSEREINISKHITCERCEGSGAEPNTKIETCSECKGSGKIETIQRTILGNFKQSRVCLKCRGKGKIPEKKCTKCHSDGRIKGNEQILIKIPAGIEDGQVIKLGGKGGAGKEGSQSGDLYVVVGVKLHNKFKRFGPNLVTEEQISFTQAVLGDKIEVSTLEKPVFLKIPAGIESGQVVAIQGKGLPHFGTSHRGDILDKIKIRTPRKVSKKVRKILENIRNEI
jgi:molecular chaperone DnaJ